MVAVCALRMGAWPPSVVAVGQLMGRPAKRTPRQVVAALVAMHGVEHECAAGRWFPPDPTVHYDEVGPAPE